MMRSVTSRFAFLLALALIFVGLPSAAEDKLSRFDDLQMKIDAARAARRAASTVKAKNAPHESNLERILGEADAAWDAKNYTLAMKLYREGAALGDVSSLTQIGNLYSAALGVPGDPDEALRWYRKAVEQGDDGAREAIRGYNRVGLMSDTDYAEEMVKYNLAIKQLERDHPSADDDTNPSYGSGLY